MICRFRYISGGGFRVVPERYFERVYSLLSIAISHFGSISCTTSIHLVQCLTSSIYSSSANTSAIQTLRTSAPACTLTHSPFTTLHHLISPFSIPQVHHHFFPCPHRLPHSLSPSPSLSVHHAYGSTDDESVLRSEREDSDEWLSKGVRISLPHESIDDEKVGYVYEVDIL